MTTKIVQTDSNLEVTRSAIQPLRTTMNLELLKVARSGDKSILYNLLPPEDASSKDPMGEMPEDAAIQENTSRLLKVTLEENTDLHMVASRGYLESAENLSPSVMSLLTAPNQRFDTPLHCAARVGNNDMVSYIIDLATRRNVKDEVLRATNKDKANALHEAAKYDRVDVARILMEKDPELASMPNRFKMSPLYLAIVSRSLNVAKFLLQFSPTSYEGPSNKTALHAAILISQEITQDLLRWKPMLIKSADSLGRTPLHYAASNGVHDIVKLLLEKDSSTAYLKDANGLFPIHIAASMENVLVVDQILEHCPDADELLDKEGKNFLHVAFKWKRLDLVRKIILKRPDLRKLLNDQDYSGNTPLHTAVENNDQGSMHFLLRDKTVLVNIVNRKCFAPLDLAYAKLNEDLPFRTNSAEVCIASCLASIKAQFGPQELPDLESGELSSDEAKEEPYSSDDNFKKKSSSNKAKGKLPSSSKAKVKSASGGKARRNPASSSIKAKRNPSGSKTSQQKEEGNEIGRQVNLAKNLGIAAVLIATVTFAAGFTLPGGYIADDHPGRGTAVLAKEYTFKVFLISDASALVCSIIATCWLMYAGTAIIDKHNRRRALFWAIFYLWAAFAGMCAAFAMGIYVALGPSCKRISIPLCIASLGAPIFAHVVANYNVYRMLETVRIRQGYKECIWPTIHLHDKKRLLHNSRPNRLVIDFLLLTLGTYAIFFLLAML
ncbi:protein ACCELERATED CELL DEATH 6-like [Elaeis guineensis]|uniref:Ankyrin repeat-containing protein NPR4-like n=1 Tax=Elaeis guineensis var. tenera TaxID=51953 RepID=A0A6I9QJ91_ELAGV|nr:ankyrin repeat-containing protein NPR4-like [Elaeis guineensis]